MRLTWRRKRGDGPRFEKALFSIMGPAQIGEDRPPDGYVPDETAELCDRCGQRWDRHERRSSSNMTYTVCPPAQESHPNG